MLRHLPRLMLLAAALSCAAVTSSCTSQAPGDASIFGTDAQSPSSAVAQAEAAADAAAGDGSEVDACSLLTAKEVAAVIGENSGGQGSGGNCGWENETDYHSITVTVGRSGSASDGQLPAPLPGAKTAPGPSGIRFSSANVAEFLIGDRACEIQVVTSVTDESDRPTAVRLIGLIRSRVKA